MKNIGIAIRSLFKRGQHNVMKIISLGIGLTIGLVLIAKVHFENTYDNFYPDGDRIYRVYEKFFMNGEVGDYGQTPAGVIPLLKQETPEIEAATRYTYFRGNSPFTMSDNKHRLKATFILADSCLFDVLPRPMLIGDPKQVLSQPMYVLVSDEIAERIGGNVMGKRFEIDDAPGQALTIGGVFKKLPDNTEQSYDIIVSLSSISKFMWDGTHMLTGNDRYQSYVKVSPGTTEAQLEAGMRQMIDKHFPVNDLKKAGVELTFTFHKLLNVHMEDDMAKRMALILSFIAFVLIFTAVMNYILIVISSIVNRTKEMAVRKCYGASGKDIQGMALSEVGTHVTVALVLVVLLILGFQGIIKELIGTGVRSLFLSTGMRAICLTVIVVLISTGIATGWFLGRIPVAAVFRSIREARRLWKLGLLFFQFTAISFLASLLLVVGKQYDHMVNDHPGYNPENLAYVYIGAVDSTGRAKLIEETQRLPEVDAITTCYNLPFWGASGNNVYLPGDDRELFNIADLYDVGNDYLNVLEIPIVEGQYFTENTTSSQEILVSRNFIEYMKPFADWKDGAVGKTVQITGHDTKSESMPLFTIRGVFEDFRLGSIAGEDPRAKIMFYTKGAAQHMVIRYHSLSSEALRKTQDLMGQLIPDKELNVISFKSEMLEGYTSSRKFRDSVMIGGIVTLLIVFIGLIGYTNDEVNRRRKEMAIRKINGATVKDILHIFLKDIITMALPAILLGCGIAFYISQKWQEQFSEKIQLSWYLFVGGGVLVLTVILAVSGYNVFRTTHDNPVNNLKSE